MENKQTNTFAIVALVCGIFGAVFCWFGWLSIVALIASVVGIIFGVKGMQQAKVSGVGKGLAVAGMVCGIVGAALSVIGIACYASVACAAARYTNELNELIGMLG